MLRMDQVHVIRHKVLVEGRSIRSIAREMGVGRNTIKKYLTLSEPVRVVRQKKPSPVMEMVAPRIEQILTEWWECTPPQSNTSPAPGSTVNS
jgi:transposase